MKTKNSRQSQNIEDQRGQPMPSMAQQVSADQAWMRLPEAQKLPPKSAFSDLSSSVDDYMTRYINQQPQPGDLAKKGNRLGKRGSK